MNLFYDGADLASAAKLRDPRFRWLQELGALELAAVDEEAAGFLFGYEQGTEKLLRQVGAHPAIHDQPDERQALVNLDEVLKALQDHNIEVPTPRTWLIEMDNEWLGDLKFPLFVRTRKSSWKRGGGQAKVDTLKELADEAELLRRTFGWDAPIIVREWLDIAVAGRWMFGDAPQEVRTWIVDGTPVAWSFHYLHAISDPAGFPPSHDDLKELRSLAARVAKPFRSRLIAADFVRDVRGDWYFLEAGPGAACGTAHEKVFKFVASKLVGRDRNIHADAVGGPF